MYLQYLAAFNNVDIEFVYVLILTMRPVSARGGRVTVLPSTRRLVQTEPSLSSLQQDSVS